LVKLKGKGKGLTLTKMRRETSSDIRPEHLEREIEIEELWRITGIGVSGKGQSNAMASDVVSEWKTSGDKSVSSQRKNKEKWEGEKERKKNIEALRRNRYTERKCCL